MLQILLLICVTIWSAESYLNSTILFPFQPRFIPIRKSIDNFILPNRIQNGVGWNQKQQLELQNSWYTNRNAPFYNLRRKSNNVNTLAFQRVPQERRYYKYDCTNCCNCCQSCRQLSLEFLYPHPIQIIKQQTKLATSAEPLSIINTTTSMLPNSTKSAISSVSTTTARPTTNVTTTKLSDIINMTTTTSSVSSEATTTPLTTTTELAPTSTNAITTTLSVVPTKETQQNTTLTTNTINVNMTAEEFDYSD